MNIESISFKPSFSYAFSSEELELSQKIHQIVKKNINQETKSRVASRIKNYSSETIKSFLEKIVFDFLKDAGQMDPYLFMERLSSLIPIDVLGPSEEVLKEAKTLLELALIDLKQESKKPHFDSRMKKAIDGLISALETLTSSFGLAWLFKPSENVYQAEMKCQKIVMLATLFSTVATLLVPFAGVAGAGLLIGGFFLALSALSFLWPYIKPMPAFLTKEAQNITDNIKDLPIEEVSQDLLDKMATEMKEGNHVFLVGPSRVGKSMASLALAKKIKEGAYPELKGMSVFRCNAAVLNKEGYTITGSVENNLKDLAEAMGRHRRRIILILDEAHNLCKNGESLAEILKPFLDKGGGFEHVIAITTDEEYDRSIKKNKALSFRFKKIPVLNMGGRQTVEVLKKYAHEQLPFLPEIPDPLYEKIYELSKKISFIESQDAPQPLSALKFFEKISARVSRNQKTDAERKIERLKQKILQKEVLAAKIGSRNKIDRDTALKKLGEMKATLHELDERVKHEKKLQETVDFMQKLLSEANVSLYKLMRKISDQGRKTLLSGANEVNLFKDSDKALIKKAWLMQEFFIPQIGLVLREGSKKIGLRTVIDEELIDQVSQEFAIQQ